MLAGAPTAAGLAARMHACLGQAAPWCTGLAERFSRRRSARWQQLSAQRLALEIEADVGWQQAWRSPQGRPTVRRYLLRPRTTLNPPPLGLQQVERPDWPNVGALAQDLGVPLAGLWRLCKPATWQRRTPGVDPHYRRWWRPKRSGGWRLLEMPLPHLMGLQRRLLERLLDRVPPHEAACGFTRERSVLDHARAHAGQAVVLKFDLTDFFGSVRASRVHAIFSTLGYADDVARALTALCTTATPEPLLRAAHRQGQLAWEPLQRLRDPHLPQGAPSSPALANLCAFGLDLRLAGLADALQARYTRYADDLVLSGGPALRQAWPRVERWVARIAAEEGFSLNHRKTRCQTAGRQQSVCHIVVNRRPNLARDEFDRLKAILHQCVRDGPSAQNRMGHPHWREHLRGRVAWAGQLNPARGERLQRLFEQIDWSR